MCFDFLYNFCPKNISFEEETSEIVTKMCAGVYVKYLLFISDFNNLEFFSPIFFKTSRLTNLNKIHPVRTELFHGDGQTERRTDMMKFIVTFCSFMIVPKNQDVGRSVAGVETSNKTLNFIENPVCGIKERANGGGSLNFSFNLEITVRYTYVYWTVHHLDS
jgi:hypothetical protein